MANNFTIVIDALDHSAGAFRSAGNNLMQLEQRMTRANSAMPSMGAVESFVARSTLLTGGLVAGGIGAIALLTSKILSVETTWASMVRNVSNKSLTLGIEPQQLFGIRNAAKTVGISDEHATGATESVSRGFYEAAQGRDPTKRAIYQAYAIDGRDNMGNFSAERLLEQIAGAGERVNAKSGPFARHRLFELLGADGIEDLLNKGESNVRYRYRQGLQLAPTEDDRRHAEEYAEVMSKLDNQFEKTKSTILGGLAPALTTALTDINTFMERVSGQKSTAPDKNVGDRIADVWEMVDNSFRGNGGVTNAQHDAGRTGEALAYYQSHGVPRNEAIGLVANFRQESALDDRAIGDNGTAYGIGQWHADRQAGFKDRYGIDIQHSTFQQQLDWSMYELNNGKERAAGSALQDARSPAEAAALASRLYFRPRDVDAEAQNRAAIAKQIDGLYPQVAAKAGGAQLAAPAQDCSAKSSDDAPVAKQDGQLTVKVELGNLPKGSRTEISSSSNVSSSVAKGSTGRSDQFVLGATY